MSLVLRVGARPSVLAVAQAAIVGNAISERLNRLTVEIVPIRTSGDKLSTALLARVGGKGLFIRELEQALSEGRIDIAVHSMKDLPAMLSQQFRLAAVPQRDASCDVLLAINEGGWSSLPPGARLGTSSVRRRFQALRMRPNLEVLPLRGNVDTRLRRLQNGDFDGIILAAAGLRRLGLIEDGQSARVLSRRQTVPLPFVFGRSEELAISGASQDKDQAAHRINLTELDRHDFVPSGGQGALAVEALRDSPIARSAEIETAISDLTDLPTLAEITAERAFLATIGASCVAPVGVNGSADERLTLRAQVFSVDGTRSISGELSDEFPESNGDSERSAARLGKRLGRMMLEQGAGELIGRE
jgi:hydroxymethylbilane synthase